MAVGELPSHNHTGSGYMNYYPWLFRGSEYNRGFNPGGSYDGLGSTQSGNTAVTITINNTGGNLRHNIVQTNIAVYYYKRKS